MVTITLRCPFCKNDRLIKYGRTPNGKQRYRCRGCGRQHRADPAPNGYTPEQREVILHAYQKRSNLRGLSRTFGVSRTTVSSWIKKVPTLPPLASTRLPAQPAEALERDERWTFVVCRAAPSGCGWRFAPERRPGASARSWPLLSGCVTMRPRASSGQASRKPTAMLTLYTDPLESYHNVLPRVQHRANYKGSGQTNHLERFNNTLRQRLGRRVRKTLSFSRCDRMLALTTRLFLQRYNTEIQVQYQR